MSREQMSPIVTVPGECKKVGVTPERWEEHCE
jgi:hypothetical protein